MADRYLLESGSPDGYLLEDGTGVLLLNNGVAWEWDNSDHGYVLSSDGLTATRTTGSGDAIAKGSTAKATGRFQVTGTLGATGNLVVGVATAAVPTTTFVGDTNSAGYVQDGRILFNGSLVTTIGTYTSADVIDVELSGGVVTWYKNGVLASTLTVSGTFSTAYPAVSTSGTSSFAADFGASAFAFTLSGGVVAWDVTSHATTGALTGPGSTIAGTAAHIAIHTSTGALTGPGSTIIGSAARTAIHTTTGALTGPGSTIAGVAVYNAKHTTSGALTGAGSVVIGAAARTRAHATTGTIVGPGSTVAGSAVYNAKHTTSGALTGPGSTLAGSATRFRAFATSGVLVGPGSTIVGSALRGTISTTHATSGALVGQPSIIDGTAARTRQHATSGVLIGPPALVVGVNTRWRDHDSSGALLGVTGVVFGRAFNGTPQLHDIPVDSDNLTGEPASPAANLGPISEPSGQIVNHPPYPPADLA